MKQTSLIALALFILLFTACTKITTTSIGDGLIPPIDGVTTKDTNLTVSAKNFIDSFAYVGLGEDNVVGYTSDGLFGKTTAKINIEIKPVSYPFSFPVSKDLLFIDSVVLVLSYKGVWGDTLQPVGLKVFEIARPPAEDTLRYDKNYNTDKDFTTVGELTYNSTPTLVDVKKLRDSIKVFQDSGVNMIRVRLTDAFGTKLLRTFDTTNAYKSDSAFRTYLGGFQIAPSQAGNALLRIGLTDDNTKLAIYYKYKPSGSTKDTSAVTYFRVNSASSGSSNYVKRNYSAPAEIAATLASSTTEDSLLYLQAGPGVSAKIKIPGLTGLQNVVIHRAELLIEEANDNPVTIFDPPLLMMSFDTTFKADSIRRIMLPYALNFNSSGGVAAIENLIQFGCYPNTRTNNGKRSHLYNFDITRYVQGIITRKETSYNNLVIYAPHSPFVFASPTALITGYLSSGAFNYPGIGQIRLGGGNNTTHKMKLHIIYSVL